MKTITAIRYATALAASLTLVAACQTTGTTPGGMAAWSHETETPIAEAPGPAGRPALPVGTELTYREEDGPVTTTLVGLDGRRENWSADNGWTWTVVDEFGSVLEWQGPDGEAGTQTVSNDHDALYPLAVGNVSTQTYEGTNENGPFDGTQRCEVLDAVAVTVEAGTYDTYKILCSRGGNLARPWRSRVAYYAPSVGRSVLWREATRDGDVRQAELLAADLPASS